MSVKSGFHPSLRSRGDDMLFSTQHDAGSDVYLNIPSPLERRASHASTFSELSDIGYMSNDHAHGPLARTISNASNFSVYSTGETLTFRQRLRTLYYQNYGALLVLLSQVFGTGMNVTARLLEQPGSHGAPMHPFQILFVRQSLTALLCTVYALWTKSIPYFPLGPSDRKIRMLLVSRGVFGFFGVFGMYFSLLYLPLSEATVLTFLAPILTCYLASYLLSGEIFTRQQQIAGFVSFVGVIFIARPGSLFSSTPSLPISDGVDGNIPLLNTTAVPSGPSSGHNSIQPTNSQHLLAIALAMLGVLGATGAMLSIRAIGTRAHAFISVNYFSVWSCVVCVVALIALPDVSFRLPGTLTEWALLINLGMCGFMLQALLTMGLSYGGPADTSTYTKSPTDTTSVPIPVSSNNKASNAQDIELQLQFQPSSSSSPRPHRHHHRHRKSQPKPSGNRATSMVYCQMLYALAADKLVFGTTLGVWSWVGSLLILGGAIWVATAKEEEKIVKDRGSPREVLPAGIGMPEVEEQVGLLSGGQHDDEHGDDDEEEQAISSSAPRSNQTSSASASAKPGQLSIGSIAPAS